MLAQRRTPAYPLVMATSVALFGRDLLAITFTQHLLGVGTAVLTFGIGRLAFGRTGDIEMEFIQPVSGASPHTEFLAAGREGIHHVRYRVDGGSLKVWKNDVTATQATFGAGNSPVRVTAGHTYDVQARSEKSTDLQARSDWSPSARVTT